MRLRSEAAWAKADHILAGMAGAKGWARQENITTPVDNAGRRIYDMALSQDVYDSCLWMGVAKATTNSKASSRSR